MKQAKTITTSQGYSGTIIAEAPITQKHIAKAVTIINIVGSVFGKKTTAPQALLFPRNVSQGH